MKKMIVLLALAAFACDGASKKEIKERNADVHIDDYSGKNISPQITPDSSAENSVDVDTISSAKGAGEQKN